MSNPAHPPYQIGIGTYRIRIKSSPIQKSPRLTLLSKVSNLTTNFPSLSLLFSLNLVYSSLPKTSLLLMVYAATHLGPSTPLGVDSGVMLGMFRGRERNRAAVWKVGRVEVRRGMCSLSYHSKSRDRIKSQ